MFKNTAGQKIGVQMVNASGGGAFTGAVTVYVTKDAGTQAVGNVGSGACVHEGNGFHTYSPDATDTNGDHVAFTFIGTGAVPVTVQVETQNKFVADVLNASARTMALATVSAGTSGTSFTVGGVETIAGTSQSVGANAWSGRRVMFRNDTPTAALKGVGGRITANTSGASPVLTIHVDDTLPATPANGDLVVIV
jgi:hypothetical protein